MKNKPTTILVLSCALVVILVLAGIQFVKSGPGSEPTPTAATETSMEPLPTFTPTQQQGESVSETNSNSTFRFERNGDLLSAVPVSPVHPDTAGHFVQLDEHGAIMAGYVIDNCFTIDTENYPADAWEYFNGETRTYHRFLLGEIQAGAPMPDPPPLNTSRYTRNGERYYWYEEIQDPDNDFWRLDSWNEQEQRCDEDPLPNVNQ